MKVISTKEMYALDKKTCQKLNISSFELMTKAAEALHQYLKERLNNKHKVIVVAGTGNNGGDAILLHKLLQDHTNSILYRFGSGKQSTDNVESLSGQSFKTSLKELQEDLIDATHVIDGLFGIGFKGTLGEFEPITKAINDSSVFVYSIDIPSGVNGNNGVASNHAIKADRTLVIEHLKYGNLLQDALDHSGKNSIIPIGIVNSSKDSIIIQEPLLPKRKHNTHKYSYGSILIIGGSEGMTGAPILSAKAALRTGTGLVHMSYLHSIENIKNVPIEVMTHRHKRWSDIQTLIDNKSGIVFGMGLGRKNAINEVICEHLIQGDIPTIIDADGIYCLKKHLEQVTNDIIITPHFGELAMLLDVTTEDIQKDPIKFVQQVTKNEHITVILKGPTTIIANKDKLVFSSIANPGLATAGSGDVLAGIIARFLDGDLFEAAVKGVYIHSLAGNEAVKHFGEESMIASDIVNNIHTIIKRLQK